MIPGRTNNWTLPNLSEPSLTIYKNIICDAFPYRRQELDGYERDIIDMATKFQGSLSYDYHRAFSAKAAAYLDQCKIKVDWSVRDELLFLEISSGHKANACHRCASTNHISDYCPQKLSGGADKSSKESNTNKLFSTYRVTSIARSNTDKYGRNWNFYQGREIYNNFNNKGCSMSGCVYVHVCARRFDRHPATECESLV